MSRTIGRKVSATSVAVLALALGGCQVLGIGGPRMARAPADADSALIANFGSEQLELGRTALKEGRTVAAIDAFMIAKSFEREAPAAYNGLAVAYSRLGREDLAERFFQEAVARAPDDTRFRANLATFYVRHGIPRSTQPVLAIAPVEPLVAPAPELAAAPVQVDPVRIDPVAAVDAKSKVSARTPSSGFRRISRHEVKIVGNTRRVIVEVGGATTPARVGTVKLAATGARTPLRKARPAYPVRVTLDD